MFAFIHTVPVTHAGETPRNPHRRGNPIAIPTKIDTEGQNNYFLGAEAQAVPRFPHTGSPVTSVVRRKYL